MLKITTVPNKILKTKTKKIERIDDLIKILIDLMYQTMIEANGVGIAAPQVNKSIALALVQIPKDPKRYKHIKSEPSPLYVLINPKIIFASSKINKAWEGCLSIPGYEVEIERPEKVVVQAQDENGKVRNIVGEGLLSKALQHEIDHLCGILITDYGQKRVIKN